ncbi:hypothetical protein SAMN02745945_00181 [Peptoclostridium litorale DSM 5388]|uniref:Uncharacterized protein n=1 Tax=Peptoclostridium litorale DSM 5388 TaxID=1121324 RepID=A0A069RQW5_PEPLI|nr:hypothetical protein [Peptoclostridium litorale]KDR96572.1 hypothetical protein CLIT_2c01780 [Peptoclostridium litorale DSM 5388]SIN68978.1 hypothetical protein SAMN02745945_00181 [Peptoclostridium litorale DSM 5388]
MYHKDVVFDCMQTSSVSQSESEKERQMQRIESKLDELIQLIKNMESK